MIKFNNVTYEVTGLRNNKIKIIDNITFTVDDGIIFGIAGQSGGGKTSIAKLMSGVNKSYKGSIKIAGKDLSEFISSRKLQILFQNNNELINPLRTVKDMIEEVMSDNAKTEAYDRIVELLELMKLPKEVIGKKGFELSGGQQQRVALARILAAEPEIIIMDEPFSAQDAESQNMIIILIRELNIKYGITFVIISHDLTLLKNLTHKIIIIYQGRIIESGETSKVLTNPDHPHTQFLINSITYDLSPEELKSGL